MLYVNRVKFVSQSCTCHIATLCLDDHITSRIDDINNTRFVFTVSLFLFLNLTQSWPGRVWGNNMGTRMNLNNLYLNLNGSTWVIESNLALVEIKFIDLEMKSNKLVKWIWYYEIEFVFPLKLYLIFTEDSTICMYFHIQFSQLKFSSCLQDTVNWSRFAVLLSTYFLISIFTWS